MHGWFDTPERPWQPLVLTNPSLDLAVAWGAAHFAWLKHTGGRRIGGGIARSYYIGLSTPDAKKQRLNRPCRLFASCRSVWRRARNCRWQSRSWSLPWASR